MPRAVLGEYLSRFDLGSRQSSTDGGTRTTSPDAQGHGAKFIGRAPSDCGGGEANAPRHLERAKETGYPKLHRADRTLVVRACPSSKNRGPPEGAGFTPGVSVQGPGMPAEKSQLSSTPTCSIRREADAHWRGPGVESGRSRHEDKLWFLYGTSRGGLYIDIGVEAKITLRPERG